MRRLLRLASLSIAAVVVLTTTGFGQKTATMVQPPLAKIANPLKTSAAQSMMRKQNIPHQYTFTTSKSRIGSENVSSLRYTTKNPLNSSIVSVGSGQVQLGTTWYDLQTNASMPERVVVQTEGSNAFAQVIWMADPTNDNLSTFPNRGSYFAFTEVTNTSAPTVISSRAWVRGNRIEPQRTGFPAVFPFSDGTLGVVSHAVTAGLTSEGLRFSRNQTLDGETFRSTSIAVSDSALWPHATASNNVIHIVHTFDTANTKDGHLAYVRSADNGQTWSRVMVTGPEADNGFLQTVSTRGANSYQVAAKGDLVAIMFITNQFDAILIQSEDAGLTWSNPTRILPLAARQFTLIEDYGDGTGRWGSDTVQSPTERFDLIYDAQDQLHIVLGVTPMYQIGTARQTDQGIEFLEGQDTLSTGNQYYPRIGFFHYNISDPQEQIQIIPPSTGEAGPDAVFAPNRFAQGTSLFPNLGVDEDGNLALSYISSFPDDFLEVEIGNPTPTPAWFGHLYFTRKLVGVGQTWDPPRNLSEQGVDCLFPSMANRVEKNHAYIVYSADNIPGIYVSVPEANRGNYPSSENAVYLTAVPMTPQSTEEEMSGQLGVQIMPNPTTNVSVATLTGITAGTSAQVSVVSMLGEVVMNQEITGQGSQAYITIPTEGWPTGSYSVVFRVGAKTTTQQLTVVR